MVRRYKRKTNRGAWSKDAMKKAVEDVLAKKVGYRKAAAMYGVPQTTLERYVKKVKNGAEITFGLPLGPIEKVNEAPAQPLPGPSSIPATQISGTNTLPRQDAPSGTIDQCRFCAAFTKCAPISDKPYLSNSTTLAFNDISVKLDFNDETLPKTVCQTCDKKLKAMHDFVNLVKSAQGALINIETRPVNVEVEQGEDFETLIVKTECDDDDESKDGIIDSVTVEETVFIKDVPTKRKNSTDSTKTAKVKKAKVTEEENELTINIKEEVIERDANDENTECSLSDVGRSISNTGSVADTGCPVSNIECSSDTGTDVKPSEVELATSALVFEMRSDGSGFGYS